MMIISMVLLFGLFQYVTCIKCYTCNEVGYFCSVPLNLEGGEEHNENDIESFHYDSNHACLSDHYIDPRSGQEKIILRGVQHCHEIDRLNHRRHCCYTNNCNKDLPPMKRAIIYSKSQQYLPSIILIVCLISFIGIFINN